MVGKFLSLSYHSVPEWDKRFVIVDIAKICYFVHEPSNGRTHIAFNGSDVFVDETPQQILDLMGAVEVENFSKN